jgi:hypothetical protein
MLLDPESIKKIDNLTVFFTLLVSAHVKALRRTLMKLSQGLSVRLIHRVVGKPPFQHIIRVASYMCFHFQKSFSNIFGNFLLSEKASTTKFLILRKAYFPDNFFQQNLMIIHFSCTQEKNLLIVIVLQVALGV